MARKKSSVYTRNKKIEDGKHKKCLACPPEEAYKPFRSFYISKSPMNQDGYVQWCKDCIIKNSLDEETGEIDEQKFKSVLRQIDKPFYMDILNSSAAEVARRLPGIPKEEIKLQGKSIVKAYMKNIQSLRQLNYKRYIDSEKDNFVYKGKSSETYEMIDVKTASKQRENEKKVVVDTVGRFKATKEIISLFGEGYSAAQYKKMWDKYNNIKSFYTLQTALHQEALVTYVRFKVQEEIATSNGFVEEAKKWFDAAQTAASNGKLTPKQLTKTDLEGSISSISEIAKAVEQATNVIKILPTFKYRPNDAPDFNIWCYVNYERALNDKAPVDYEDVYKFYDKRKEEYIKQTGDAYGIFADDTAEKNREIIKTFITLPEDYEDMAGDNDD